MASKWVQFRWQFPVAMAIAFLILVLGAATVRSDEPKREFSFTGRAMINGEVAPENTLIEIEVNGKIIGEGLVTGDDGKWVIRIDATLIQDGVCEAVFYVNGRPADRQWNRCAVDIRLEVDPMEAHDPSDPENSDELSDPEQRDDSPEPDAPQAPDDQQALDDPQEPDVSDEPSDPEGSDNPPEPDAPQAPDDQQELDISDEPSDTEGSDDPQDPDDPPTESTSDESGDSPAQVQPRAPRTGTGGVQVDDGEASPLRTAALVAYLALIIGVAALLIVSRSSRFGKRDSA